MNALVALKEKKHKNKNTIARHERSLPSPPSYIELQKSLAMLRTGNMYDGWLECLCNV